MWYHFDVQKFGRQMLPPLLRKGVIKALVVAFLLPLVWLLERFKALREECRQKLLQGGQSLSLIEAIRRTYGLEKGDVYIVEAEDKTIYIYSKTEDGKPLFIGKGREGDLSTALYYGDEGKSTPDYYLHVPDYLLGQKDEITRLIEQYKPAGRKYQIIFYPYE